MNYTKQEILDQLDACAEDYTFPMLDNGYVYPVESRISLYRDETDWVLLIEVIGFSIRGGGHKGINNGLHVFGNCLDCKPGINNNNYIGFTADSEEGSAFDETYEEHLNPEVNTMLLRGHKIRLFKDPEFYESKGIELDAPPKIMIWEFLRGIRSEVRDYFFATEAEIRERIPKNIPLLLRIDEWRHNDMASGEFPSDVETFQMIADVLESGDIDLYEPTKRPNSYWRNWPEGGAL